MKMFGMKCRYVKYHLTNVNCVDVHFSYGNEMICIMVLLLLFIN